MIIGQVDPRGRITITWAVMPSKISYIGTTLVFMDHYKGGDQSGYWSFMVFPVNPTPFSTQVQKKDTVSYRKVKYTCVYNR